MKNRTLYISVLACILLFQADALFFAAAQQAQQTSPPLDAKARQAVVNEVAMALIENYVFLETAQKMGERMQTRLKNGEYDNVTTPEAFGEMLNRDMRDVSQDKHLGFRYDPPRVQEIIQLQSQNKEEAAKARAQSLTAQRQDNFGFKKVERLDGNVGYLAFNYFASADIGGEVASSAMNFLSNCDALIVDLRQNGGGDPSQIQFITSYLFDSPVHLNDIYSRRDNTTENYWTLPYVPGKRMPNAEVYVLTSGHTFSGAEEFSYNLKNLKRATIIGETTGGGAHPSEPKVIRGEYLLNIPFARAINPITKTNWEGTGVTPDVAVPADQAYDTAYRMAIEKLSAKATTEDQKSELEWIQTTLKSNATPVTVNEETLQMYAGTYQDRKVVLENGTLYYQRTGPRFKLIPMSETLFRPEGMNDFRLEFVVKDGKAVEVIGLYRGREKEPSKRSG